MKKIFTAIVLFSFLSCMKGSMGDCHHDQDPNNPPAKFRTDVAAITATDYTACICCGGLFIDINSTQYRLVKWPASFDINGKIFPVKVKLTWKVNNETCGLIEASEIQLLQ